MRYLGKIIHDKVANETKCTAQHDIAIIITQHEKTCESIEMGERRSIARRLI